MSENFNSHIACEGTDNDINWVCKVCKDLPNYAGMYLYQREREKNQLKNVKDNNAKMCLDVMGHTTLKAKSLFEYHKKNYLDYLEEDFDDEVDSDNIERKYTFENWARAVKKYSSILASDIYENGDYISLEKCRGENNSLCEKIVLDSLPHCKDDTYFGIDFYYLDEEIGSPWDVFRIILAIVFVGLSPITTCSVKSKQLHCSRPDSLNCLCQTQNLFR